MNISTRMVLAGILLMLGSVLAMMPIAQTVVTDLTQLQVASAIVGAFTFGGGLAFAIAAVIVQHVENKLIVATQHIAREV